MTEYGRGAGMERQKQRKSGAMLSGIIALSWLKHSLQIG